MSYLLQQNAWNKQYKIIWYSCVYLTPDNVLKESKYSRTLHTNTVFCPHSGCMCCEHFSIKSHTVFVMILECVFSVDGTQFLLHSWQKFGKLLIVVLLFPSVCPLAITWELVNGFLSHFYWVVSLLTLMNISMLFLSYTKCNWSWGSLMVIVTRLQTWWSGDRILIGARGFSLLQYIRPALQPTQPPVQWVLGFLARNNADRADVNHSPVFSAKSNNRWSCSSIPYICLHGMYGDKNLMVLGISAAGSGCSIVVMLCINFLTC